MGLTSVIFDIMFLRILTNMSVLNLRNSTEDLFDNDDMERPFNRIRGLAGSGRGIEWGYGVCEMGAKVCARQACS